MATDPIELHVVGIPQPQGNKTGFVKGGHVVMVEGRRGPARENFKSWRQAVQQAAADWLADHPQAALAEPVEMGLHFRFPLPKSDPYRTAHTTRPDLDKLVRSVFDALKQGGLIADDSMVYRLTTSKRYCEPGVPPGCRIEIWPQGEAEGRLRQQLKDAARSTRKRP